MANTILPQDQSLPILSFEVFIISEAHQTAIENLIASKPHLIKRASIPFQGYNINVEYKNQWEGAIFKDSTQLLKIHVPVDSYKEMLAEAKRRIKDVIIERDVFEGHGITNPISLESAAALAASRKRKLDENKE